MLRTLGYCSDRRANKHPRRWMAGGRNGVGVHSLCSLTPCGKFCLCLVRVSVLTGDWLLGFQQSGMRRIKKTSVALNCSSSWNQICQPLNSDVTANNTILHADAAGMGKTCRQKLDWFLFPFAVWEGCRQHIPHPCQALSAKSTWPGPRTAPPELCHERGAGEETG